MHTILVTGGAGYIGSHTAWLLHQQGYQIIILDSLVYNQSFDFPWATCIKGDVGDRHLLATIFTYYSITAVMHFAAFIEVGRSVTGPAACYQNNVVNTLTLLNAMRDHGVNTIIFSSSCAVYGEPQQLPLTEDHPHNPLSPYGDSKHMAECIMHRYADAYGLRFVVLRYFNAAGSLPEHNLGERHEPETHIIPLLLRAAMHKKVFTMFGTDHATPDGTCIRDYVHVLDIADAHIKAYEYLQAGNRSTAFNLGTGHGFSVREVVSAVQEVIGASLNIAYAEKRAGDPAILVADATKAREVLGWQPSHSELHAMVRSAYQFALLQQEKPVSGIHEVKQKQV